MAEDKIFDRHHEEYALFDRLRDSHTTAHIARLLSALAIIGSAIAIALALSALNKANEALSKAVKASQLTQSQPAATAK